MTTATASTTSEVLGSQAAHAEQVKNDEAKDMSAFAAGDAMPQGDLYIVGLKAMPGSTKVRKDRQLADGTTQGSRHIHEGGKLFDADPAEVARLIKDATGATVEPKYVGPVFQGGTIRHPEHGDHENYPADVPCAVVFQRSLDREEREQRVAD